MDRFNQRHPWGHNEHFHPWTMHHLPGARCVALDVGADVARRLVGVIKHPSAVPPPSDGPAYPTRAPRETHADLRGMFDRQMPGARLRRRVGFRYTASWTRSD